MSRFLVGYVSGGCLKETRSIKARDVNDLICQLGNWHPFTMLEGYGFTYITNGSHWAAAGYPDDTFTENYREIRAPAHINPPFFHILRSVAST
jgi:hypothetical protein